MSDQIVIRRCDLWTKSHLLLSSVKYGVFVFWVAGAGYTLATAGLFSAFWDSRTVVVCIVSLALLAWPVLKLDKHGHEIQNSRRAALAGIGFGAGLIVTPMIVFGIAACMERDWSADRLMTASKAIGVLIAIPAFYATCAAMAWTVLRHRRPNVLVQDGSLCPCCGYNIIACVDMICSECGERFSYEELETTASEFAEKAALLLASEDSAEVTGVRASSEKD